MPAPKAPAKIKSIRKLFSSGDFHDRIRHSQLINFSERQLHFLPTVDLREEELRVLFLGPALHPTAQLGFLTIPLCDDFLEHPIFQAGRMPFRNYVANISSFFRKQKSSTPAGRRSGIQW
jgi:hypothetical protein